jgi:hypothetical protein
VFGEHLLVAGEQQRLLGAAGWTALNLGGSFKFNDHTSLIFSFGHSFAGASNALGYIGVDFTWGSPATRN